MVCGRKSEPTTFDDKHVSNVLWVVVLRGHNIFEYCSRNPVYSSEDKVNVHKEISIRTRSCLRFVAITLTVLHIAGTKLKD